MLRSGTLHTSREWLRLRPHACKGVRVMAYDTARNCHGCKHLDRYKIDGNGYCCRVERSSQSTIKGCRCRVWGSKML